MPARDVSLRRALTTTTVASVGSALFLMCAAFVAYELVTFRATMVRTLSTQAAILARQSTTALFFNDPESAAATLRTLRDAPHVVSAGIYGRDGTLFASYMRGGAADSAVPRPAEAGAEGHSFEKQRLVLSRPIMFDDAPIGAVVIESDLEEMRTRLQRYALIVLSVLAASFVLAYGTASRLQRTITGPVLSLVQTAQVVSSRQDYSVRAAGEARGELGLLVRTFNDMLGQIQERDAALQQAREELESQVDDRTKDLQREVAERKALGEELHRKNQALQEQSVRVQEATRLKSEFLANMSHELRTPLNAIVGFAELLHDGKVGPVSPDQRDCLADILTSSRHLLQLINDVLDLSKVEAGKMEFRPETVELDKLVGEVRDILRGMSAKKRIVVSTEAEAGLGMVTVDPAKLKQVLYNYLSNALKFTPEGGHVVVRTRAEGADRFRIEVEDTGVGVKPEDLPRLFVEFQQLDTSTAKAHPGTGLGLALTKRIVEAQGGSVGVRSAPGQGSLFLAVLPRVTTGPKAAEASYASRPSGRALARILVVEDDAGDRAWLVDVLSRTGYAVEVASTGGEAVDLCRKLAFDGITLDLLLPDVTGWDVLRELRASGLNQNTPVIVTTVIAEKGLGEGFAIHDYLVKPLQAQQLLASLRAAGVQAAAGRPILVVDDDPHARRLMETTLLGLGYRPVVAASGEEGIRAAEAEPVAAVILDLVMPGMDGFGFLERFRTLPARRETPVIVWTAKDLTAEDYRRLGASAQAVVLKREGGAGSLMEELRLHVARAAGDRAIGRAGKVLRPPGDAADSTPEPRERGHGW